MKPTLICLMLGSIDGKLHPSRFTASPDGARGDWTAAYEKLHEEFEADGWLVGRVTMAEMSKAEFRAGRAAGSSCPPGG